MSLTLLLLVGCSTVDITFHKYDPDQQCLEPVVVPMAVEDGWAEYADARFFGDCINDMHYYFPDSAGDCWALLDVCEIDGDGSLSIPWAVWGQEGEQRCGALEAGTPTCGA